MKVFVQTVANYYVVAGFMSITSIKRMETLSQLVSSSRGNPEEFDLTVASLLVGLDAEKYIDIFRQNNIGQTTLFELCDEDLELLGVEDENIRKKIIAEVKSLPIYEEIVNEDDNLKSEQLDPDELEDILSNSAKHLHNIQLSLIANKLALKKSKHIKDYIVYRDMYASHLALKTLDSIEVVLQSMENVLENNVLPLVEKRRRKKKKLVISAVGSGTVVLLAFLFYRSLKYASVL